MEKYIDIIKRHPLFKGFGDDEIADVLCELGAKRRVKSAGEYIFRVGDRTDHMGFVLSGTVMVIQEDLWGHRHILSKLSSGDIFAEIFASIPDAVLNVNVVADTDCEILMLNIRQLLSSAPSADANIDRLIRNLASLLARKTLALNDKVTHISKRTTRDKLLSFLSAEAARQGSLSFDISFNRQQLADYLCVERTAMSVELSKLQKENILHFNKNHFELQKIEDL